MNLYLIKQMFKMPAILGKVMVKPQLELIPRILKRLLCNSYIRLPYSLDVE